MWEFRNSQFTVGDVNSGKVVWLYKKAGRWTGALDQWLKASIILTKNLGSIPNTQITTQHLYRHQAHMLVHRYTHRESTHTYKIISTFKTEIRLRKL